VQQPTPSFFKTEIKKAFCFWNSFQKTKNKKFVGTSNWPATQNNQLRIGLSVRQSEIKQWKVELHNSIILFKIELFEKTLKNNVVMKLNLTIR
jgi:hypothetical protein